MRHRTVQDVMTHQVVTAHRDTPFKEVAALLARNDVSAVPVVDSRQRPIGKGASPRTVWTCTR